MRRLKFRSLTAHFRGAEECGIVSLWVSGSMHSTNEEEEGKE